MSLGKRLKEARINKGLTQEEAAKRLRITFQALSNYERDYRDPDTELLSRIAELYGVTTDYLLCRTDNSNPTAPLDPDIKDAPMAFYGNTEGLNLVELEKIINRAVKKALEEREREKREKEKGE